ncbi:MAG: hypothetical protein NVV72_05220 [Asticcacaulis sp.]|nr:hypothetical protein [Asticcacaulis sp.]
MAGTLRWSEERRRDLGQWWDAAQELTQTVTKAVVEAPVRPQKSAMPEDQIAETAFKAALAAQKVTYVDYTDAIESARAELAAQRRTAKSGQSTAPPFRGPP